MRSIRLLTGTVLLFALFCAPSLMAMSDQQYLLAMTAMHAHDVPVANPVSEAKPARPVQRRDVVYAMVNGEPVRGYLAEPLHAKGSLPSIIVIHEWWGLNANIRSMADQLAGEGYVALAVDLYGGHAATTPAAAEELMRGVLAHKDAAASNLRQAYGYLHDTVHASRIGVIGWCFGGGWSLQTALMLPDKIDATVMYYGRPVDDVTALSKLKMPLLGFFGAEDKGITPADVHAFEAALKQAHINAEIHIYPGAGHAFANPSGTNYRPAAAADAWKRTLAFFAHYLKGQSAGG
ncbi:MAG: dienelactone hydrolase family protein [Gammaproteobacteria bacterium]